MSERIIAIDPGREKCGLAVVDDELKVLEKEVVSTADLLIKVSEKVKNYQIHTIIIGDRTHSRILQKELQEIGLFRISKKSNKQQNKPSVPLEVKLDNATIYIGRNNQQNDYLTFKIGRPNDIWLHVQKQAGSHVIIKCSTTPDEATIKLAAELAAYFSKSRNSSSVAVDYVQRKHVWKPAGAKPGFVLYENQNTVYVTPDADKLNKIL